MTGIRFSPKVGELFRSRSDLERLLRFGYWVLLVFINKPTKPEMNLNMRVLASLLSLGILVSSVGARQPNVILVMTDDQGYGDLSCHGNPDFETPNLDRLHSESVRFTDFHVDPTCAPTRAALITGRYSLSTSVWHTIAGRSFLHPEEVTIADAGKISQRW